MLSYINKFLHIENVSLQRVADRFGTPVYVYSLAKIRENFKQYVRSFSSIAHLICYAIKANSNNAVLSELARLGSGADIVSGGELYRALRGRIRPDRIVYSGVGKTDDEIQYALNSKILMFNVESMEELKRIDLIANRMNRKAPIAFRVNPDIDGHTHHHITTGKKENKFGIHFPHVLEHYIAAKQCKSIHIVGLQAHIGSQLLVVQPYVATVKKLLEVVNGLDVLGIQLKYLDIGGGIGIQYHSEKTLSPGQLARAILPLLKKRNITLILEPGRSIVGDAGCLLTSVLYRKYTGYKHFVIVDAGMNDLIRPAMYDAYHEIMPVVKRINSRQIIADIVGPVCETGDYFAQARKIAEPMNGDVLAIASAGAYAFSMSSQYNSRPRAAEVMISGKTMRHIQHRETYKDIVSKEV